MEVIENKGRNISRFLDFSKKVKELSDRGKFGTNTAIIANDSINMGNYQ